MAPLFDGPDICETQLRTQRRLRLRDDLSPYRVGDFSFLRVIGESARFCYLPLDVKSTLETRKGQYRVAHLSR